jgi:hypothetical protein
MPDVPVAIGASLTGATAVDRGTLAALTAVVPPLWAPEMSTPTIAWGRPSRPAPVVVPLTITVELSISRTASEAGMPF